MSKILDIIIPEYNTDKDVLIRALNSVNRQKNINFNEIGVVIVSDGSRTKYKSSWFKQRYPKLNIIYYPKKENEGPGLTRQYGIDRSDANFITFLDSDDELYENDSLAKVIDCLVNENLNVLWTDFIEEKKSNGKMYITKHAPNKFRTLHGLFVKRQFLVDNNLKFSDKIRYQEDTYFCNVLAFGYDCNYLSLVSYVWKYNETSLVRNDKKMNWNAKIIEDYIEESFLEYVKLTELNKEVRHKHVVSCIYGAFLILNSESFDLYEERKKKNLSKLVELFYKIKKDSYDILSDEEKREILISQIEATSKTMPNLRLNETFEDYLKGSGL